MKPSTLEWIAKADADLLTARRELAAADHPNYDAAAFHAQQCAEKCLKARLVEEGSSFPKTHDLAVVLALVIPLEPSWDQIRPALDRLTAMAVEVRYPGMMADREDAAEAVRTAEQIRGLLHASLGV
jgi:HEPN domain-containing protein